MVFRKLGNKWVVDLNGIYTYNDIQQFDFNIFKEFFENKQLYRDVLKSFESDEVFSFYAYLDKNSTACDFSVTKKDFKEAFFNVDKKYQKKYLELIKESNSEDINLQKNPKKSKEIIKALLKPLNEETIEKDGGKILGLSMMEIYDYLIKLNIISTDGYIIGYDYLLSDLEAEEQQKEQLNRLKKGLRASVLRKSFNHTLRVYKNDIDKFHNNYNKLINSIYKALGIKKSNGTKSNYLLAMLELTENDYKVLSNNIDVLRRYYICHKPLKGANFYLRDVLDDVDDCYFQNYTYKQILIALRDVLKYLRNDDEEKIAIEKLLKKKEKDDLFSAFISTDNRMIDSVNVNVKSEFVDRILSEMPHSYNSYQQAYYIYKTLCQAFNYDSIYWVNIQKDKYYKKNHLKFSDINAKDEVNNTVICYDESIILAALLEKVGYMTKIVNYDYNINQLKKMNHCQVVAWNGKYCLKMDMTDKDDLRDQKAFNNVESFEVIFSEGMNLEEDRKIVDEYFEKKYPFMNSYLEELKSLINIYSKSDLSFKERLNGLLLYLRDNKYDMMFTLYSIRDLIEIFFGENVNQDLEKYCDITILGYKNRGNTFWPACCIAYNESGLDYNNGKNNNYIFLKDFHNAEAISYDDLNSLVNSSSVNLLEKSIPGINQNMIKRILKR